MTFPVYLYLGPLRLHPHFVMEALAYGLGLYFMLFRRRQSLRSPISFSDRTSVSLGALVGALLGAKLLVMAQHMNLIGQDWRLFARVVLQGKTIVGALLGGLIGVEVTKKQIGLTRSTGDGFVWSVLFGMMIGRIGCFLTGLSDRTYGIATTLPWGVDFGDGIARHPTQLYEVGFLLLLALYLRWQARQFRQSNQPAPGEAGFQEGDLFKAFMIAYLTFRLSVDFIKPEFRPVLGLSAIQIACIGGLIYYRKEIRRLTRLITKT